MTPLGKLQPYVGPANRIHWEIDIVWQQVLQIGTQRWCDFLIFSGKIFFMRSFYRPIKRVTATNMSQLYCRPDAGIRIVASDVEKTRGLRKLQAT
jgi:hypothetical protein